MFINCSIVSNLLYRNTWIHLIQFTWISSVPVMVSRTVHHLYLCVCILHIAVSLPWATLLTFSALADITDLLSKTKRNVDLLQFVQTCFSARLHFRFSVRWTEDDWRRRRKRRRDKGCSVRMNNSILCKTSVCDVAQTCKSWPGERLPALFFAESAVAGCWWASSSLWVSRWRSPRGPARFWPEPMSTSPRRVMTQSDWEHFDNHPRAAGGTSLAVTKDKLAADQRLPRNKAELWASALPPLFF